MTCGATSLVSLHGAVCILAALVLGGIVVLGGDNEAPKAPKSEARRKSRKSRPKAEAGVGFLGSPLPT